MAIRISRSQAMELSRTENLDVQRAAEERRVASGMTLDQRSDLLPDFNGQLQQRVWDRSTAVFGLPESGSIVVPEPTVADVTYPGADPGVVDLLGLPETAVVTFPDEIPIEFRLADRTGRREYVGGTIGVDVPLLDLRQYHEFRGAQINEKRVLLDGAATEQSVMRRADEQYLLSLLSHERVRIREQIVEMAEATLKLVKDQAASGRATSLDVNQRQLAFLEAKHGLAEARIQSDVALRELRQVLNLPADAPVELTESVVFRPIGLQALDDAETTSLAQRPDYLARKEERGIAKRDWQAARAEAYPVVSLFGNVGYEGETVDDLTEAYFVGAFATIPIWDAHGRRGVTRQKEARLAQVELRTSEMERTIHDDIYRLSQLIELQETAVEIADEAVRYAHDGLVFRTDKETAGLNTSLAVIEAEVAFREAEFDRAEAVIQYEILCSRWFSVLGEIETVLAPRRERTLWHPGE